MPVSLYYPPPAQFEVCMRCGSLVCAETTFQFRELHQSWHDAMDTMVQALEVVRNFLSGVEMDKLSDSAQAMLKDLESRVKPKP